MRARRAQEGGSHADGPRGRLAGLQREQALERVLFHDKYLLILGVAGTGKTTLLKELVERLRALGKQVDVLSLIHI